MYGSPPRAGLVQVSFAPVGRGRQPTDRSCRSGHTCARPGEMDRISADRAANLARTRRFGPRPWTRQNGSRVGYWRRTSGRRLLLGPAGLGRLERRALVTTSAVTLLLSIDDAPPTNGHQRRGIRRNVVSRDSESPALAGLSEAAGLGFEPRLPDPESGVLPLD